MFIVSQRQSSHRSWKTVKMKVVMPHMEHEKCNFVISDAILPLNVICAFFADSKSQLLNFVSVLPPFRKSAFPHNLSL